MMEKDKQEIIKITKDVEMLQAKGIETNSILDNLMLNNIIGELKGLL